MGVERFDLLRAEWKQALPQVLAGKDPLFEPQEQSMTPRQAQCLDAIKVFIDKHHYSPSYQELMEAIGSKSKSNIHRLVHGLAERGHITVLYARQRSIRLNGRLAGSD